MLWIAGGAVVKHSICVAEDSMISCVGMAANGTLLHGVAIG